MVHLGAMRDWCVAVSDSPDPDLERDCKYYRAMTNADRIRSMTDEELAQFMFTANGCPMWVSEYSCKEDKGCAGAKGACWLDWLKQECGNEST